MSEQAMLPCPFCGNDDVRVVQRPDRVFRFGFCGPCGAQGPLEEGVQNEASAEARWNRRPPMEAVAWREKAQIVTEWLAMARETPKPLHSSLNYVPVSPSEFEALEAILQAMRGA